MPALFGWLTNLLLMQSPYSTSQLENGSRVEIIGLDRLDKRYNTKCVVFASSAEIIRSKVGWWAGGKKKQVLLHL